MGMIMGGRGFRLYMLINETPWRWYGTRVWQDQSSPIWARRVCGTPAWVRLLNGPFTPSPLFEASRLWHFCKLGNQIILQGFPDLQSCGCFFTQGTHLLHNTLEIVIKMSVLQTLADSGPLVILDLPKNTAFNLFLPLSASGRSVWGSVLCCVNIYEKTS